MLLYAYTTRRDFLKAVSILGFFVLLTNYKLKSLAPLGTSISLMI
jgi:hypothetical protein